MTSGPSGTIVKVCSRTHMSGEEDFIRTPFPMPSRVVSDTGPGPNSDPAPQRAIRTCGTCRSNRHWSDGSVRPYERKSSSFEFTPFPSRTPAVWMGDTDDSRGRRVPAGRDDIPFTRDEVPRRSGAVCAIGPSPSLRRPCAAAGKAVAPCALGSLRSVIVWAEAVVSEIRPGWRGAAEVLAERADTGATCRALAYTDLTAAPRLGDRLLLNVAALDRGLGTGGYALVVAVLDADGHLTGQPPAPAGHLVKARYLPQQAMVAGADEQGSPFHETLAEAEDLAGLPVVVADLHSALPAVLAAVRLDRPATRVVYLMSDHGALPLAFSRTVAELTQAGWLAATVTAGQAFGGDLEAVNVHSGLLAARLALDADIVVLTQGPGNLGTGTRWGFSGVACGEAVNAAGVLGGRPVASLRVSGADARDRHLG